MNPALTEQNNAILITPIMVTVVKPMILISQVRCSDCLNEFKDGPRFAVVKEDQRQSSNEEERRLGGHLYQVLVCSDCARWYEDPVEASVLYRLL